MNGSCEGFPSHAPRAIRATLYRYDFVPASAHAGWWKREALGVWLPPLTSDDPRLLDALQQMGWLDKGGSSHR